MGLFGKKAPAPDAGKAERQAAARLRKRQAADRQRRKDEQAQKHGNPFFLNAVSAVVRSRGVMNPGYIMGWKVKKDGTRRPWGRTAREIINELDPSLAAYFRTLSDSPEAWDAGEPLGSVDHWEEVQDDVRKARRNLRARGPLEDGKRWSVKAAWTHADLCETLLPVWRGRGEGFDEDEEGDAVPETEGTTDGTMDVAMDAEEAPLPGFGG